MSEELLDAVCRGSVKLTKSLLDEGHDVNSTDENGRSLLLLAATQPHTRLAGAGNEMC